MNCSPVLPPSRQNLIAAKSLPKIDHLRPGNFFLPDRGLGASGPGIRCAWRELFRVLFQHGGHAGLITAATGLVRLDRAFFKAQRDQNLARFFLRAALAAFAFLRMCGEIGKDFGASRGAPEGRGRGLRRRFLRRSRKKSQLFWLIVLEGHKP